MIGKDVLAEINGIDGWLTNREADFLYTQATKCPKDTRIVEIGSYKGKSTVCLARGSHDGNNVKITSVDPSFQPSHQEFKKMLCKKSINDIVDTIEKPSVEAAEDWSGPISLLFIDGNHDYSFVLEDFLNWEPFLISGGIVAFHDTTSCPSQKLMGYPGPKKVVDQYIFKSDEFREIHFVDTLTYATKGHPRTQTEKLSRFYTRSKKQIPDFLLFTHSRVFLKLPQSFQDGVRNFFY